MKKIVKISELRIDCDPQILITRALGSCVAVCLYERHKKIGGLCHFILPNSSISREKKFSPGKFADTGIKMMVEEIVNRRGGRKSLIEAKIVGGAKMFSTLGDSLNIGDKNVKAAEKILKELRISILARDVGEDFGRNVSMYLDSGTVEVTSFRKGTVKL
ncbi:MAG: hypothetical protein B6244_01360 [Candidatus Cloacimonetes bacterium 4572_55]|nr:MAG: hypothetical protein B6244_01360 [Candidatus Cloacimonetes bacterium 4572_55]